MTDVAPQPTAVVGLGLVGLGRWSQAHAAAAARSSMVRIVACHSRDEARRRHFAKTFDVDHTAASFDALLSDPTVDAVVVATPNDLHVEMALAALAAGKPALIDKPICVDVAGGLELIRARPSADQIGVAHHARRLAGLRRTKRWLDGEAGSARFATANFSNARGAVLPSTAWYAEVEGSEAGVLIQVGIHQVDNLLWLFGPAVAVNARLQTARDDRIPKGAVVIIAHRSGVVSTVTSSWTTPGLFAIEIQADEGNLRYRLDHGHWSEADVDRHGQLLLDRPDRLNRPVDTGGGDPLREQLEELGAAANGSGSMEVDVVAGVRTMAVVLAAVRSASEGGAEVSIESVLRSDGATAAEVALLVGSAPDH